MQIKLGIDKYTKEPVLWKSDSVVNRHFIIAGESGSGKTHTLKGLIHGLATSKEQIRCYVVDVHADIKTSDSYTSTVVFGATSNFGLQPLAMSSDRYFGGVNNTINRFLKTLSTSSSSMGELQYHALYSLMVDMYKYYGFFENDPLTWSLDYDTRKEGTVKKKHPTVADLISFLENKQKEIKFGTDSNTLQLLNELSKNHKKIKSTKEDIVRNDTTEDNEKLETLKQEAIDSFTSFITKGGDHDDMEELLKRPSIGTIDGIIKRLETMYRTGIFKEEEFSFDPNKPIQRLNIKSLETDAKKAFVQLLLNKIFSEEKAKGETKEIRCAIILDEAKDYSVKNSDGLVERIILEGRKFGIMQILAGQQLDQFNKDTISNCATKILLGVDQMYFESTRRTLNIPLNTIKNIVHKKNILVSLKQDGDSSSEFKEVEI